MRQSEGVWESGQVRSMRICMNSDTASSPLRCALRGELLAASTVTCRWRIYASRQRDGIMMEDWTRAAKADGQGTRHSHSPSETIVLWLVLGALAPPHSVTCDSSLLVHMKGAEYSATQGIIRFDATLCPHKSRIRARACAGTDFTIAMDSTTFASYSSETLTLGLTSGPAH